VTVKSSPSENSIDLFVVHEGTKVKITDSVGDWYEIRIANGSVGWMKAASVKKI
jgi:SH3-like domain-containing protein